MRVAGKENAYLSLKVGTKQSTRRDDLIDKKLANRTLKKVALPLHWLT